MNTKFVCTGFGEVYYKETETTRCIKCNEPVELEELNNGTIDYGKTDYSLSRYRSFYPWLNLDKEFTLGEGFTPLVPVEMPYGRIYIKNESINPTWSFKDRGTITGVLWASKINMKAIGTVSTGNMAASVAAYGAKAGMETVIFVKEEMPAEKLSPITVYGARVIKVKGDYGELYKKSIELGRREGIYFINSDSPFRVEGYKTIAFEIFEQLGNKVPDFVIVPVSAGGNIRGIEKGFRELKASGYTDKMPKFVAVQARGCNPIERGFLKGEMEIERVTKPDTIAHAIENPFPPSGNQTLRLIKRTGGTVISVDDSEILNSQGMLARRGLFVQTASAASETAAEKLINRGIIKPEDIVVCIATASGLKFTEALKYQKSRVESINLEELQDLTLD
ncbi:MAG: threonine synthase [Gudongella sp.]|nr:threonine synthase [Gudongella sp.]